MDKASKSNNEFNKKISITSKQRNLIIGFLLVLFIITSYVCVYRYAYNNGQRDGYKSGEIAGKKSSANNPADLFNKSFLNPFNIISGKVEKIEGDKLTINTNKGEVKTINLKNETKITKKTESLKPESLSKGTKVTIYLQGDGSNSIATRIVVN